MQCSFLVRQRFESEFELHSVSISPTHDLAVGELLRLLSVGRKCSLSQSLGQVGRRRQLYLLVELLVDPARVRFRNLLDELPG